MTGLRPTAVALCFVVLASIVAPRDTVRAQMRAAGTIEARTLANGLKVVVVEDHAVPVVQTAIWYRFGASGERIGRTGLAHALEHMMFRGTPSLSGLGLDDVVARLGAQANATTANDYTHFYFVMPADKLDLAVHIEADRMQNLSLTERDWRVEKSAILNEYDTDLDQPLTKLYVKVCSEAASSRLCPLAVLGERGDIVNASVDDLRAYYRAWYVPNNATLVIAGDVRAADAFAAAQRWFAPIPSRALPDRNNESIGYATDQTVQIAADFPYQVLDIAYAAPGTAEPGSAALTIADAVINSQRSIFYKTLVESGIALGYSTQLDQNLRGGLYHVFIVVAPGNTGGKVRDAFLSALKGVQSAFPSELVAAAKVALLTQAVFARDSIDGLGERVGYAVGVEGLDDPARDDAKLSATSALDVTSFVARDLATPAVVGVLQPLHERARGALTPPVTAVADDFSKRPPAGPITEARWVQDGASAQLDLRSRVAPTSFALSNGLRVLVQPIHSNATVFVNGTVETSPRFDPPRKEGLGAMASALLAYGSARYDFDAQRKTVGDVGATVDLGFTFDAHGNARDLGRLLDVIGDALAHPQFSNKYLELVRRQTLAAIHERDSDPDYAASHAFEELVLKPGDATLRQPVASSVRSISASDLHGYAANYVRPDVTTISIVGDVDAGEVARRVQSAFGAWRAPGPRPHLEPDPLPPPHSAKRSVFVDRAIVDAHVGMPAPSRESKDYYALNLMNELLGADGDFDTRLMDELRTRRSLAYSVSSTLDTDRYRGVWNFHVSADPRNVAQAVSVLKHELARMQYDPVGLYELNRAKTKLIARALVSEESTQIIAARVQNIGLNDLPTDESRRLAARYDEITPADLIRVAKAYIQTEQLVEVDEGPRL